MDEFILEMIAAARRNQVARYKEESDDVVVFDLIVSLVKFYIEALLGITPADVYDAINENLDPGVAVPVS